MAIELQAGSGDQLAPPGRQSHPRPAVSVDIVHLPMPHSLTPLPDHLRALSADLRRAGVSDVRFDDAHRLLYSTDASIYQVEPLGVVIPRTVEEVVATVAVCAEQGVPLLPRGGGSSLAGQTVGRAVVVDTSRYLDHIVRVDVQARQVRCQPGVVLDRLNRTLRPMGLMVGPDPASSNRATVGGTVGNNGTGSHSILYGMMADHVVAAQVVLADGSLVEVDQDFLIRQHQGAAGRIAAALPAILNQHAAAIGQDFPRHWRRASGYNLDKLLHAGQPNLAQLLAGSEGTLAFMTEVTLNLVPRPRGTVLGIVHFDDLIAAAEATVAILELDPSAVELMDSRLMGLCRQQPEYARRLTFVEGSPACVLAVEFYVQDEAEGRARLDDLCRHLTATGHHGPVVPLLDAAAQANVWAVRKAGLGLLLSQRGDAKPVGIIEDVAVPPEYLADYLRDLVALLADQGKEAAFYAHASAGCLHIRPLMNLKDPGDVALIEEIQRQVLGLIGPLGGVLSGEHGDGLKFTHLNPTLFGPRLTQAFAEVKLAFDPHNLFNPGKKVQPADLAAARKRWESLRLDGAHPLSVPGSGSSSSLGGPASTRWHGDRAGAPLPEGSQSQPAQPLRYGSGYQTMQIKAQLDWTADGGFSRAVEMCNGSGDCRKLGQGVMCPSFQALREEEHSTRGRANLLRGALSGSLPHESLTGDRLHQALDLCLGCKACRTECPSSVDLAKIKVEVLAQRYARHGVPLSARAFGNIHALSRLAAPIAPLANRMGRTALARRWLARAIGLHPDRSLPPFAHQTFPTWFARREQARRRQPLGRENHLAEGGASDRRVLLFADTFTTFNYPAIGQAAVRVLEAAGLTVQLAPSVCCGRPQFSQGLVAQARRQARRAVQLLYPLALSGLPILVCEPSCASMMRDEYADLIAGSGWREGELDRTSTVARQTHLFDDWLAGELQHGLSLPLRTLTRQVLFHGHCHQKAGRGTAGSLALLRAVPGYDVSQIDAGCCGMAGAFGYTADHYALSQAVVSDRLLPAIEAAPDAILCADGASCRQQVEHFTGRPVHHVVELVAGAL